MVARPCLSCLLYACVNFCFGLKPARQSIHLRIFPLANLSNHTLVQHRVIWFAILMIAYCAFCIRF